MEIKFGVYFTRSLGTLYKDNEIDVEGMEANVDLNLSEVNTLTVTFKVGEASFTDYVTIKDIENGLIQIPFKNDVFKAGLNSFEIIALMKNGDVKASQTYTYYIEKSLENPNRVEAETNYPVLITLVNNVQNALNAEAIRVLNEEDRQILKGQVEVLKTNLESLVVDLNALEGTIETNENTRQSNEEARQTLKDSMSTLKSSLESLQTDLNTLESNVETNESTRQSNEATRGTTFTSKINAIDTKIIDVEARTVAKETLINNKIVEANTTITNTNIAKTNTEVATNNANTKITETEATRQSIITTINNLVAQFNALAPTSSTNAEVQLARTDIAGKTYASLQERLLADNKQQNILYSSVSGTYITSDSVDGYAKNVVIEGNTYQNPSVLSEIKSTGTKLSDGRYEIPLLSRSKNMFNKNDITNDIKFSGTLDNTVTDVLYCISNFIKVKPNTTYYVNDRGASGVCAYGSDRKVIRFFGTNPATITTASNEYYIKITILKTKLDVVQLEEGTVATPFESYKEDKLTILSDYQIEKVGTVADRILQLADNKWYTEKNDGTLILDGSILPYRTILFTGSTDTVYVEFSAFDNIIKSNAGTIISDKFKYNGDFSNAIVVPTYTACTTYTVNKLRLSLPASVLTSVTNQGVSDWLKANNVIIKYQLATPIYCPLSDDQQVSLKTFATKTNILSLCEIEPTIKCDVPKSTSASINSINENLSNVSKDLERVKKLEDATNSTVVTDKDFVNISDTANGYLSDVKLEGRTLNQIVANGNFANGTTGWSGYGATLAVNNNVLSVTGTGITHYPYTFRNTAYNANPSSKIFVRATVKVTNSICSKMQIGVFPSTGSGAYTGNITNPIQNQSYTTSGIVTLSSNAGGTVRIEPMHEYADATTATGKVMEVQNVMALDLTSLGMTNYTSDQINSMLGGYIEGLKSVGQDVNKIVVSSIKGDGNLLDVNKLVTGRLDSGVLGYQSDSTIQITNDGFICTPKVTHRGVVLDYAKIEPSKSYYLNTVTSTTNVLTGITFYDSDKKYISNVTLNTGTTFNGVFTTPINATYIRIWFSFSANAINVPYAVSNITLNKGTTPIIYRPIETDKKEILYLDTVDSTWKKPVFRGIWSNGIMTVGDIAEKKADGKYSYRKRMLEKLLNGSENWTINATYTNTIRFVCSDILLNNNFTTTATQITALSDKFEILSASNSSTMDKDGISQHSAQLTCINISKSKLTTQDVAGFKAWLASNNVTVVYQLATELVYECTPIDLASYDSEINYYLESGVLSPRSTIKVSNYIGNIINNLKEKVSIQENQNSLMRVTLLNHEARLILGGH